MDWSGGSGARFYGMPAVPPRRVGSRGVRVGSTRRRHEARKAQSPLVAGANVASSRPASRTVDMRADAADGWGTVMQLGSSLLQSLRQLQPATPPVPKAEETADVHEHAAPKVKDAGETSDMPRAHVPSKSPLFRAQSRPGTGGIASLQQRALQMKQRVNSAKEQVRATTPGITEAELNIHPAVKRAREWVNAASKIGSLRSNQKAFDALSPEDRARLEASERIMKIHDRLEMKLKAAGLAPHEIDPNSPLSLTDQQKAALRDATNITMKDLMEAFMPKVKQVNEETSGESASGDDAKIRQIDISPEANGLDVDHPARCELERVAETSHADAQDKITLILDDLEEAPSSLAGSETVERKPEPIPDTGLLAQIADLWETRASTSGTNGTRISFVQDEEAMTLTGQLPLGDRFADGADDESIVPYDRVCAPPMRHDARDSHALEDSVRRTFASNTPIDSDLDCSDCSSEENDENEDDDRENDTAEHGNENKTHENENKTHEVVPETKTIVRRSKSQRLANQVTDSGNKQGADGSASVRDDETRVVTFRSKEKRRNQNQEQSDTQSANLNVDSLLGWAWTALDGEAPEDSRKNARAALAVAIAASGSAKQLEKFTLTVLKPVFRVFDITYSPPKSARCEEVYQEARRRVGANADKS